MRHINAEGLEKIKQWEGLRLTAYQDTGGVWTIGYGSTDKEYAYSGNKISEEKAEWLLKCDLARAESAVERLVTAELSDNQFAALVSFVFNVGTAAFKKSTLLKKLNKGDYNCVPSELARWNKDNGKVVEGLVNRRAAEAGLWALGAFIASAPVEAAVSHRPAITPERVAMLSTAAGSVGALSVFDGNGPVQWVIAAVILGIFVVGVVLFLKERRP